MSGNTAANAASTAKAEPRYFPTGTEPTGSQRPGPFYFGPSYDNPTGVPGQSLTGAGSPEMGQQAQLAKIYQALQNPTQRMSLATQLSQVAPPPSDDEIAQFSSMASTLFQAPQQTTEAPAATAPAPLPPNVLTIDDTPYNAGA